MFAHQLAANGIIANTVTGIAHWLDEDDAHYDEFYRLWAFYRLKPFGELDLMFGRLMYVLVNMWTKSNPKLKDYLLGDYSEQVQTPEEMEEILQRQYELRMQLTE